MRFDPTTGQPGVATDRVEVDDLAFAPAVIEVPADTEVTWTFTDTVEHNVAFDHCGSDVLRQGDYHHTFVDPGEHPYVCTLHPLSMKGRVIVESP